MSIANAILGFLSWQPLSGYDLKKRFADLPELYWSGNSNQIYTALVDLHKRGLVSKEVQLQESLPARKVYSITPQGRDVLRTWVQSMPDLPVLRNTFLVQLGWADLLSADELDALLAAYENELAIQVLMLRENAQRQRANGAVPQRTPREAYLWDMISDNWIGYHEHELNWVRTLRAGLRGLDSQE